MSELELPSVSIPLQFPAGSEDRNVTHKTRQANIQMMNVQIETMSFSENFCGAAGNILQIVHSNNVSFQSKIRV